MKEVTIYESRIRPSLIFALITFGWAVLLGYLTTSSTQSVSTKIILSVASAILAFLTYTYATKTKKQDLTVFKNYGLLIKTRTFLGSIKETFWHKDEIENCLVYEYLSPIRVLFKLGLKLRNGKLFCGFYVK